MDTRRAETQPWRLLCALRSAADWACRRAPKEGGTRRTLAGSVRSKQYPVYTLSV